MDFDNTSDTELSELGEFGLIKHLTQHIEINHDSTIKGVGDDAAVIDNDNLQTVISTDMLVEGVHFDLTYVPLKHLGYKSVVVNLSDIYAMNALPKQIVVSIAISNRFKLGALEELYAGMLLACKKYNVDLVGGDTTSSLTGLVINITAIGAAKKEDIAYRNGAQEGNLLCVSGDLGGAYMGLQILEREKTVFKENPKLQPDLEGKDYILERQLKPEARKDIFELFEKIKIKPTSMIDVSDGLSSEILHLCTQSNVGVELYEEKIPIDPLTFNTALEFNLDPTLCALSGGEDYELLFTVDIADYEKVKNIKEFTIIGHITNEAKGRNMVAKGGTVHELKAQGWNALLKK
ncbi:MAG: thiamine-phosphate kinase [Bacteroidota bacterium]|nr:thiamine-phosphate kinase [Bacteroidota bacterium]MDP3144411.1 thiamine-phosphate kinase [Bacteroidota bacterium]MDP3555911.1 thiamine-phosphate kinase [Bacteroidota bacterium]